MDPEINGQSLVNTEDESAYCYHQVYANNVFYSPRKADAKLTVKMMRQSVFDNNLYWNMGENVLETANDAHAVQEDPILPDITAMCGYSHIGDFAILNKKLHDRARLLRVFPSLDAANNDVKDKRFLGAFSKRPD